jgi:hypothetical protein
VNREIVKTAPGERDTRSCARGIVRGLARSARWPANEIDRAALISAVTRPATKNSEAVGTEGILLRK